MTLISIVLALAAERFLGSLQEYRRFDWFDHYLDWFGQRLGEDSLLNGSLGVVAILGSILLPVTLICLQLDDVFSLFGLVAATLVLIFSLGPRTFYEELKEFCTAYKEGNEDSARWYAEEMLGRPLTAKEEDDLPRTMSEAMFSNAHERLFAVLFWFLLLGPLGALLYRLSSIMKDNARIGSHEELGQRSRYLHYLLAWLPSRLLALTYAAGGNFVDGIHQFRHPGESSHSQWDEEHSRLLVCVGLGALSHSYDKDDPSSIAQAGLALIRRSVALWIGLIALMTLTGLAT